MSPSLTRRGLKAVRRITGDGTALEEQARSVRNLAKFRAGRPISRRDLFAVRTGGGTRFGVYGMGGCDVRTIVGAGPILAKHHDGTLCIGSFAKAPAVRSDLLLQTLDPPPPELTAEVSAKLGLADHYFSPILFEPTFGVPRQAGLGEFPKNVVVLSISADVGRTLYRHREHEYLVDPGGWWLASDMKAVLNDLSMTKWFAGAFRKVGRIGVEESMANFERLVTQVRERTGAFVVMQNVLTVDPGSVALDYKQANSPNRVRRRQFVLALADLARRLDFPVLDVDRLAKAEGISGQADFVHYTPDQKRFIAREFAGILRGAGIIGAERRPHSGAST